MAGGRFDEGGALERLRGLADLVSLIALGLVVLPTAIRGEWRALLAASPFGAAVLWFGLDRYEDVREVVQGATDLWLSSMPPTSTLALLVLGIVGVIAWPLGAWRRGRGMGVAIAVLLAAAAGFLPTANETFLLAWCGLATAVRASSGRIEARAGLARLFD
ncbi:MAG: hypothetical protein R3F20_01110 [Planctomycetota bacterium]